MITAQALAVGVAWMLVAHRLGFYRSRRTDTLLHEFRTLVETWLIALAAGTLLVLVFWNQLSFSPLRTFTAGVAGIAVLRFAVRMLLRSARRRGKNYRRVALVGTGRNTNLILSEFHRNPHFAIQVVGLVPMPGEEGCHTPNVPLLGCLADLPATVAAMNLNSVILCPSPHVEAGHIQRTLELCDEAGVQCFYSPGFLGLKNLVADTTSIGGFPALTFSMRFGTPGQLAVKRLMDILGATIGLALCLPVLIAVALAVKLSDGGPIFFRQTRIGRGGRTFRCVKFRTMCVRAEAQKASLQGMNEQDGPVFKIRSDPRVTRIGRYLRKYSLDELPQLFNVLKGDMSLVGPRPPVPSEVERYEWWQRRRIAVRPGLTCVWQVWGRNKVSFKRWVEMDLFYIDNWSLWMDVKLMLHTVRCVVRGTGA